MKPPCCPRCQCAYSIRVKDGYGRYEKGPLLLRCGHSFCEGCLKKVTGQTAADDTVLCPTCQLPTKVGGKYELYKYLHPDVYIVGLLSAKRMELEIQSQKISGSLSERCAENRRKETRGADAAKSGALCSECRVNNATCQCVKCDCIMCQPCFYKVHQMSFSLKKHQPVPYVPESEERSVKKKTRSQTCATHDQCHIEYFCRDDKQAICSRCVIMGDHKGHNVQTMEDKNKEALAEMEPAIHLAQEVAWRLGKADKTLREAIPAARVDTREITDEIREHFTHLHSILQAREEKLLDEVREASLCAVNPLQELKSYLAEEKMKLDIAIMDAVRAMHGNIHRVVDADLILERLKHAKDVACVLTPKSSAAEPALRFVQEQGNLQEAIASYGAVTSTSSSHMFSLSLPSPDAEKPPPEVLHLPSVGDTDEASNTDTESIADTASVVVEEEKEESLVPEVMDVKPAVYPPLKKLTVGHCEKVMVTHIRTPSQFYVQLRSRVGEMESLSRNINSYCRSPASKKDTVESVCEGDIVLAQYSHDKMWYRARVTQVVESEDSEMGSPSIGIFFIDYGNSEITTLQKIRNIQKRFLKLPAFAHECSLFDIVPVDEHHGWSTDAVQTMFEMTNNKPMIMTVVNNLGSALEVDLSRPESERMCTDDRPVSVRDSLVFLEMAVFNTGSQLTSSMAPRHKRDYVTLARMPPGTVVDVGINCVRSPSLFYSQPYGDRASDYLRQLLVNMQELYKEETRNLYTIYCPRKGMICAAQYSKDGNWYRARVTGLPGGRRVEVQFVDYGNTEVVDHSCVRKILDDFIKYPAQAVECSLTDVEPADGSGEWSEEALSWFANHVSLQLCQFRVTKECPKPNTMEGALYAINIDNNSLCCLNAELVKNGFARSTGPWSQVDNFEGITLKAYDQEVPELREEDLAAAASPPLSSVCHLHGAQLPHQSAASAAPPSPTRTSTVRRLSSSSSSPSGTSTVSPVKKADGPRKTPKNRSPVKNEAAASQASQPEPTKRLSKPDDLSVAVSISAFQSPADFHIQLKEKESDLKKLMEQLKVYEAAAPIQRDWKVGEYCAAKSAEDGRWFRARLCYVGDDGVCEVQMVDYGFLEVLPLSALQTLKKKHVSHECFAERCHLADLLPAGSTDRTKWSQTGIEFVVKQLKGKELFVKLEGETVEGFGLPVDLLIEETIPETPFDPPRHEYMSLKQMLLEKGLALPARRGKSVSSPTTVSQPKADPFCTKVVMVAVSASEEDEEKVGEQHGIVNNMVAIFQPDLHVAPHPAPVSTVLILVPVYVDHDGTIYAHDITEEESNSAFFERIDHYVRTEAPEGHLEVKIGQICLAHFAVDNVWYRARVLEVEPEAVKVKYIDFGNSAVVLRSQLKLATPELCRTPQLAYQLVLHNMKPDTDDGTWPITFLDYIHSQVVNFRCTVEIKGSTSSVPLEVDLLLSDGRNLSATLMSMGVAVPKNDMEEFYQRSADITSILQHSNPYFPLSLGKVDSLKYVLVTHIELPNLVYLQRSPPDPNETMSEDELRDLATERENLNEFVQLMDDLNNLPPQTPALGEVPASGEMCSAKYSADNRWYRGLVAKAYPATKTALIFYVDYGNSEVVPLQRLRVLPARFQDTPAQAVRAYLNVGLPEGRKRWTLDDFTAMADTIYLMRHAALIKNTDPLTVELYSEVPHSDSATLSYQQLINSGTILQAAGSKAVNRQTSEDSVLIESDTSEDEATVPV